MQNAAVVFRRAFAWFALGLCTERPSLSGGFHCLIDRRMTNPSVKWSPSAVAEARS